MSQPLKHSWHNDLAKVSGRESWVQILLTALDGGTGRPEELFNCRDEVIDY
jgi:hypothetical protein